MSKNYKPHEDPVLLNIKFDITMLNSIIGYLYNGHSVVNRKALNKAHELFSIINTKIYENNPQLYERILFIRNTLHARIHEGLENQEMILAYCQPDKENKIVDDIVRAIPIYNKLNYNELRTINKAIEDRLKYAFILQYKDRIYESMERIDSGTFSSYREVHESIMRLFTSYINQARKASSFDTDNSICISDEDFEDKITTIVQNIKDPGRIIKTGIRALNDLLGNGYEAKRLYVYMGLPSGFKSGILLKGVVDTKKYNPNLKERKPGKRPCALLVTMENYLEETVERLFNMVGPDNDIREFTPKQVVNYLRKDGQMRVSDENHIDIVIKYLPNRAISTQDLYTIIDNLEDEDKDVVMLVLDYIKRIRSSEKARDEKEELKNVTNELKNLAIDRNIAVVTAHQLNREAARTVDAALEANKTDLARFVGRANVGSAWEVMENADCSIIINKERKRETQQEYLTIKKVKQRYRNDNDISYFNHPFAEGNTMKLIDDVDLEGSVSEMSLGMEAVDASDERRVNGDTVMEGYGAHAKQRTIVHGTPDEKPKNDFLSGDIGKNRILGKKEKKEKGKSKNDHRHKELKSVSGWDGEVHMYKDIGWLK